MYAIGREWNELKKELGKKKNPCKVHAMILITECELIFDTTLKM